MRVVCRVSGLVGLLVVLALPAVANAAPQVTSELVAADGFIAGGQFGVGAADVVSEDGRYVAFAEDGEVWLRDTAADTTTLVSRGTDGLPVGGSNPSISSDGRWVAFGACGLLPGSPGMICLWDRQSGGVEVVSRASDGTPFSAHSWTAGVSADGRYVSFISGTDVYVRDRAAGETTTVNRNQQGQHFITVWESGAATSISDDGDVVVFEGYEANTGDWGVIVSKRSTGALTLIAGDGLTGKNSQVSGNGRFVVYRSNEDVNLPVYVYDLSDGTSERVGDASGGAGISDDGRYVTAFDGDGLYRYDRETDTRVRVAVDTSGTNVYSGLHAISGDGSAVAFEASNDTEYLGVLLARVEDDPGDGIIRPTLDPQAPPKDAAWGWGYNWLGVLGTGAPGDRRVHPGEIGGLPEVDALATGLSHSLGVEPGGTAWAWGYNGNGQLGDGTTSQRSTPVLVSGMTGVDAVAAGGHHSLAVKSAGGSVRAWGYNANGQLGDGTTSQRSTPVQPLGLTGVDAVAAGANHSLAVKSDGTVWAWGYNANGQVGDDSTSQRQAPVQVSGLTGIDAVAAGTNHSLAVKSADGSVWAWGNNANGQLGDNSISQRQAPVQVSGLIGVDAVAAGESHSVALKSDGTVWAWGDNGYGQLGNNSTGQRLAPVQVSGLTGVIAVAAGQVHSVALKSDGTVWAWGYNGEGSLGDGTIGYRYTPVQVKGLVGADAVAAGGRHSLAVGRASPTQGVESFTQALPAGATVTTDVEQDGATPDDPLETTLTTPVAGTVSIAETPSSPPVGGFSVYGRSVQITAPAASAADPLVIRFRLDASIFLSHWPLSLLSVHRNGNTVGDCTGPAASPDPCVEGRTRLPDGDVEVVVRTSAASDWTIGRPGPTVDAGGPYTVAEGSKITLNGSAAGGQAPFSYRWLGAAGELNDPSKARPNFTGLDDAELTLNLLVTDAADLAGTDDTTVTVTNRPPIVSPLAVDKNQNRRLEIGGAFADPGRLDTHTAVVRWGDGTQSPARVSERHGIGVAVADHQYARKGTYTVRLTVRDDDGGERSVERRIEIR